MRVLLIGGGGLIGSSLESLLFDEGHKTLVLDKFTQSNVVQKDIKGESITGDACSFSTMNRVFSFFKPEAVFHLAGSLYDKEGVYDFQQESITSILIANNISKCIKLHGAKYVFFGSSGDVYLSKTKRPISEEILVGSVSYSGTTNLYVEDMFRLAASSYKYEFTALRFFQVTGNRKFLNPRHDVASFFVDSILKDEGIILVGPKTYIDILNVTDAVKASYIVFSKVVSGTTIKSVNIGSGKGVTLYDLFSMVSLRVNGNKTRVYKYPPAKQTHSLVANNEFLKSLGWKYKGSLENELDKLVEFRTRLINGSL